MSTGYLLRQLVIVLFPSVLFAAVALSSYQSVTRETQDPAAELQAMGADASAEEEEDEPASGLDEPEGT